MSPFFKYQRVLPNTATAHFPPYNEPREQSESLKTSEMTLIKMLILGSLGRNNELHLDSGNRNSFPLTTFPTMLLSRWTEAITSLPEPEGTRDVCQCQ